MLKKDLAAGLGISTNMLNRCAHRGMPTDSIEAARRWRAKNLESTRTKDYRADGNTGRRIGQPEEILDGYDRLDRPGADEATMFISAARFAERNGIERYGAMLIHLAVIMSDEGHAVSHELGEVPEAIWDAWTTWTPSTSGFRRRTHRDERHRRRTRPRTAATGSRG